nr:hypothetical protein [Brevibacillus laterosporus]
MKKRIALLTTAGLLLTTGAKPSLYEESFLMCYIAYDWIKEGKSRVC